MILIWDTYALRLKKEMSPHNMEDLIVVIPVCENLPGLHRSLDSLRMEWNHRRFDVLLIDDSPTPKLSAIDYSVYPFKTFLLTNKGNAGVTASLNRALDWIRLMPNYRLMARLDAGDVSVNRRIKSQAQFLDEHPDCVLVGGAIEYMSTDGRSLFTFNPPVGGDQLRRKMHLNNYVGHPASMMRINAVMAVGGYRAIYPAAEDYDLFWRLLRAGTIANLPGVILRYEVSTFQVSGMKRRRQLKSRLLIQLANFEFSYLESYLGILITILAFVVPRSCVIRVKAWQRVALSE